MEPNMISLFLKMFFFSTGLVSIFMITIWIKQLHDKNAEFTFHSCKTDNISNVKASACAACGISDITDCHKKS